MHKRISTTNEPRDVPQEIKKWNWTAYYHGPWWAIRNKLPINKILISLIPFLEQFIIGKNGNKWAWQYGLWESIDHFKKVQKEQYHDHLVYLMLTLGVPFLFFVILLMIVFLVS